MKINEYITGAKGNGLTAETQGISKDAKAKAQNVQPTETGAEDKVQLSDRSREIARVQEMVRTSPEVRSEKVAEIRARIQAGTYDVSAHKVADALLQTIVDEKV